MIILYSVYEDAKRSVCITQGYDLTEVLEQAMLYYENISYELGEYGAGHRTVFLEKCNEDTDRVDIDVIELTWHTQGPFDAMAEWGTHNKISSGVH